MKIITKQVLYVIGGGILCISFLGMVYYGFQSFVIETETVESKEYAYHFALIAEEKENDYWKLVEQGAKKAATELDIYLEYVAPDKADNEEMLKLFDRFISAKVDGVIIQGIDEVRFIELVHKAVERGIPVITVDADVNGSERKAYVGTDNFLAGQLLGQALMENTKGKQQVGVIMGRLGSINQQERLKGFKEAIADTPRIKIVDIMESNITTTGATQAAYSILKKNSTVNVIVGLSALDGIGIVEGSREVAPNKKIYVTAFDLLPGTIDLIQNNKIDITVAQYPEEMGYRSVEVMIDLQTKDLLENHIFTDTKIISKKDLFLNGDNVQ